MDKNMKPVCKCSTSTKEKNTKSSEHSQSQQAEDAYFKSSRGEPAQVTAASYSR